MNKKQAKIEALDMIITLLDNQDDKDCYSLSDEIIQKEYDKILFQIIKRRDKLKIQQANAPERR